MKKTIMAMLLFILIPTLGAWGQLYLTTTDEVTVSGRCLDSAGFYITPDSVRIVVYRDGIEEFDAWFDSSDAQCIMTNGMLIFTDVFGDIDNDAGDGLYEVMAGFFEDNGDLYYWKTFWAYIGVDMSDLAAIESKVDSCLDSLQNMDNWVAQQTEVANIDGWNPITDNDSLIIDQSTLEDLTIDSVVRTGIGDGGIAIGAFATGAINATAIANNAIGSAEFGSDAAREIAIHVADTVLNRDTSTIVSGFGQMLKDTSAYQGMAGATDSQSVYGAVVQVLEDSTAKYQGAASGLDSSAVYRNVIRANRDSGFVVHDTTLSGYYVNPFIGLGDTAFAMMINADDYLRIPNDTASCVGDSSVGVHPSVLFIADSIGVDPAPDTISALTPQFTYLMGYNPFGGSGEICGNQKENPCILGSNDGDNWVIPFYIYSGGDTTFIPNPLVNAGYFDCEHLSDIKLMYARDTIYCYYRVKWSLAGDSTAIYCQTSIDVVNWSDTIRVKKVGSGAQRMMSPVVFEEADSSFTLIYIDDSAGTVNQVVRFNADEPVLAFDTCTVDTLVWIASEPGREAWHLDISPYGGEYHAFVTESDIGGGNLSNNFGVSKNGQTYIIKHRPCLTAGTNGSWDDHNVYKMCGIACDNRKEPYYDVWYSARSNASGSYHIGRTKLRFGPPVDANMFALSDDVAAADLLERVFDGTGGVSIRADIDGYIMPGIDNNLITNGSFEVDSVFGFTPPSGWTFQSDSMSFAFAASINDDEAIGRWRYRLGNWTIDTVILSQSLGYLEMGVYTLSAKMATQMTVSKLMMAIYDSTAMPTKGYVDSLVMDTSGFARYIRHIEINSPDDYTFGVIFYPETTLVRAWIDDIRLERVEYFAPGAAGTGAKSYTIFVADTTNGDTILLPGVVVSAYSMSGVLQSGLKTDSFGKVKYSTSLDSLILVVDKINIHADPDTIVIADNGQVDTTFVNHGTIPTSGSPDLCRVYGFLYDISGNPDINATVTAWLPSGVCRADSTIISPFKVQASSDDSGYFYLDLIPSGNLIPDTTKYEVTISRSDGTILRERIVIPDQESWLLTW
jgi:hypothetical protein